MNVILRPVTNKNFNRIKKIDKDQYPVNQMQRGNKPDIQGGVEAGVAVDIYPVCVKRVVEQEVVEHQKNEKTQPFNAGAGTLGKIVDKERHRQKIQGHTGVYHPVQDGNGQFDDLVYQGKNRIVYAEKRVKVIVVVPEHVQVYGD
jgi:hypothetical protein